MCSKSWLIRLAFKALKAGPYTNHLATVKTIFSNTVTFMTSFLTGKFKPNQLVSKHKLTEVDDAADFVSLAEKKTKSKKSKQSLETRLEDQDEESELVRHDTGHVMTFGPEKSKQKVRREGEERRHREERRLVRRSAKTLKKDKLPPRFWMGKRVR